MLYPNPFDFDRSGDLGFPEKAFQNEFLSGTYDEDEEGREDDDFDED